MANTISNMKMTNPIKGLVSKRRKRFTEDGYNLDLSCILAHCFAYAHKQLEIIRYIMHSAFYIYINKVNIDFNMNQLMLDKFLNEYYDIRYRRKFNSDGFSC